MVLLAYDGSLNGDWVARYAIHLAAQSGSRSLTLLHVADGGLSSGELKEKIGVIEQQCTALGVSLTCVTLTLHDKVETTLLKVLPAAPDDLVVCGTRVRKRSRGYLLGTVAERLLAACRTPVLALRVVQPGLLGQPRSLLLPFGGHPRGCRDLAPLLKPLLPTLESVHLLRAMVASSNRLLHLTPEERSHLRQTGLHYLHHVHTEIELLAGDGTPHIDEHLVLSADWANEILVLASRIKVQLMLLGAGNQPRWRQFLRPSGIERLLGDTPCDVGIYQSP
jgi:nucleotide-binding universal stress UspA family protein